jgi:hypothetical protein
MSGGSRSGGVGAGRALVALMLFGTGLEYLLGVEFNLYGGACIPQGARTLFSGDRCGTQPVLEAHVALGVIIGLLAVVLVAWAVRRRIPGLLGTAFGGLLGIVIAAAGGYEYLSSGMVAYSLLMSIGFLIAFGSYFSSIIALRDYARGSGGAVRWMPPTSSMPPP